MGPPKPAPVPIKQKVRILLMKKWYLPTLLWLVPMPLLDGCLDRGTLANNGDLFGNDGTPMRLPGIQGLFPISLRREDEPPPKGVHPLSMARATATKNNQWGSIKEDGIAIPERIGLIDQVHPPRIH
ncbi:MAG: hypothetical protein Q9171_005296 [Xanthocarpia ochracea]